jgi:hypothetical protein
MDDVSLFTFNIQDAALNGLAGLSVQEAEVSITVDKEKASGKETLR